LREAFRASDARGNGCTRVADQIKRDAAGDSGCPAGGAAFGRSLGKLRAPGIKRVKRDAANNRGLLGKPHAHMDLRSASITRLKAPKQTRRKTFGKAG